MELVKSEVKKMKALDIANYIVWYVKENHKGSILTHVKLQKIMYYAYAEFLKQKNKSLFNEKIAKWQYGPVIREVYDEFRVYGYSQINSPRKIGRFILDSSNELVIDEQQFSPEIIDLERKEVINEVIDKLIIRDAFSLVDKTHRELSWKNYEKAIMSRLNSLFYTDEEIKKYAEPIEL